MRTPLNSAALDLAKQLGKDLAKVYKEAEKNEKVKQVILFGIRFYKEIPVAGAKSVMQEAIAAGEKYAYESQKIRAAYLTELAKGVNLGKDVVPRRR